MAEKVELRYRSVPEMFFDRVAQTPERPAFAHPAPGDAGDPVWLIWREIGERATAIAAGLVDLGVRPEDRVAILANTRLEWILADLGVMCAGAATTTVYPTTEPEDAVYIVRDSGATVVVAENPDQAAKLAEADLAAVVLIDGDGLTLASLEQRGARRLAADPDLVTRIVAEVRPDQLATLIYTSGTTGRPKGVELTHAGWVWQGWSQADTSLTPDDLEYLWLPLSHSFGKTLLCGIIHIGLPTYVDGRVDKLVENLGTIRPTVMCSAPRVFEKVYNRAVTTARAGGPAKWRIFRWAVDVGRRASAERLAGRPVSGL